MKAKNCTVEDLERALTIINEKYEGNVIFNRGPERKGRQLLFTLKVKDSRAPGSRIGHSGRRLASACWHVHGDFFDALFEVNDRAVVKTGNRADWIDINGGNWQDWNIGSRFNPMYYSEACDC